MIKGGGAKREQRTPADEVEICSISSLHSVLHSGETSESAKVFGRSQPPSVYDRKRKTVPRYRPPKRLAGSLYIDKEKRKAISFHHRLSQLLWTSYRHCKRAGLTKGVNRPPGPPIYQALMLDASRVSSIRETVCIAS